MRMLRSMTCEYSILSRCTRRSRPRAPFGPLETPPIPLPVRPRSPARATIRRVCPDARHDVRGGLRRNVRHVREMSSRQVLHGQRGARAPVHCGRLLLSRRIERPPGRAVRGRQVLSRRYSGARDVSAGRLLPGGHRHEHRHCVSGRILLYALWREREPSFIVFTWLFSITLAHF